MKNGRLIFWLFASALTAVLANVLLKWQTPSARVTPRQFLLEPSFDVLSVKIERPDTPATVLSKIDGKWLLTEPYSGEADAQTVLKLIDAFSFAHTGDTLSSAELFKLGRTTADFGLQQPNLSLVFSNAIESVGISFGAATPMSNEVYVARTGSEAVYVVDRDVMSAADLSAEAFRERAVFPFEPDFVTGFDVKRPNEAMLSFTREGDSWRMGDRVASLPKVREFLTLLSDANASGFIWPVGATNESAVASAAFLSGFGLDSDSAVVVTLRCRDGVDRRLLLGREVGPGETYALIRGGEAVVTLPSALKAAALQNDRAFSDARLFPLADSAVASFSISDGTTSYVIAHEAADTWRLDAPVSAAADAKFAAAVLGRILALTPADLDPAGLKVTVSANHPSYVVSARSLLGAGRLDDFRSREILKVDTSLVRRLVSTSRREGALESVSLMRSRERRAWTVESGANRGDVRLEAVNQLLAVLSPLQASRIVTMKASASDLVRFGLEKPHQTIAVDQEKEGAVRRNILIGAETHDGFYATVGSSEAVFILPKSVVGVLTAPLIGR